MQLGQRHIAEKRFACFGLPLHEINAALNQLRINFAAHFQIVEGDVAGRFAAPRFHHVGQRHHGGVIARRAGKHAFVGGARYAVPLVKAALMRQAARPVTEVPFAVNGGGVTLRRQQLAEGDLPGDDALRQSSGHRLQRTGAYRMTAGHQCGTRRHAI